MVPSIKDILAKLNDAMTTESESGGGIGNRTGLSKDSIKRAFIDHLFFLQGKYPALATNQDYYSALAYVVRDRILHRWISSAISYRNKQARTVAYLSAEFLMGPHLENNLLNLGIFSEVREAIEELELDFQELVNQEEEPGLGNGGLGRLAACYLDSMATLEIPNIGYGIRYEFGIFDQEIKDGWQIEKTDVWLRFGNPWEIIRPEWRVEVKFGGHTETYLDDEGNERVRWFPSKVVEGVPYDTPILGYRNNTANTLRLWSAQAPESFDFSSFNSGDYYGAIGQKVESENLTKVLYPNDEQIQGKELRLEQQMFFVSCSLQDMIRITHTQNLPLHQFHEKFVVQLNDTHPAIAIIELMRLFVDEHDMDWEEAWEITKKTFAYTNHTLLPEALEKWPIDMFARLLPRHLEILLRINKKFLRKIHGMGKSEENIRNLSLIDETGERYVRMAHLACIGSFSINGVAELHSELLKKDVLKDFYEIWPEKFNNKTNGITPRRWLMLSNPDLVNLIREAIGADWKNDLTVLSKLQEQQDDRAFLQRWHQVKHANKVDFAKRVKHSTGIIIDPNSMFDVQVKRIHEYKRQHLNILHVIHRYLTLKDNPNLEIVPRTYIFGGKAAPGYYMAKLIIKLINSVAEIVNKDPQVSQSMKIVFLPNYNVSNGQWVYPAAELSEQISTAGKEASGTGNMKFALNGAITIGTLDGANIEIREEVGAENFFLFGKTTDEIKSLAKSGYHPARYYEKVESLSKVIDSIKQGLFSKGDSDLFRSIVDNLLYHDPYFVFADFESYVETQLEVDRKYRQTEQWTKMSVLNTAKSGKFSSDRSIQEYAEEIWKIKPHSVRLLKPNEVKGT